MGRPLTPLALTVLRMLCDEPMHPYQMQQRIRDHHYDAAVKITHGALYHWVERLATAGLIEPVETSRDGRRPERTVYAVTDAGRDAAQLRMAELIARPSEEYPLFGTALAFVNLLPEQEVARLLRSRVVALEASLAAHESVQGAHGRRKLERYKLLDHELTIAQLRTELEFCRSLAGDLESGRLTFADEPDGDPPGPAGRSPETPLTEESS
ncbi:PadR family transcriptional regulator [Actinomadura atramentaria]|uniref:PadR family transcriptional regulator n=1 Tax=Actinomadura atramentaria TaxID=1990 RepID=UPI000684A33E|nr:PadR family transcriptional regulator [Actinomadura atramentaria]